MANRTDPLAQTKHGLNPQNLVEKITRLRVWSSQFWKEKCFALDAERLVDVAADLEAVGGTYGGNNKATPFLCLVLKMLQIQPEKAIVIEFIKQDHYKYVRALGAFYLRLVGNYMDVYKYLEPLLEDFRKLRRRTTMGWELTTMDQFVDELLEEGYSCDIALPRLPSRIKLEDIKALEKRVSLLEEDESDEEEVVEETETVPEAPKEIPKSTDKKADKAKDSKDDGGNEEKKSPPPKRDEGRRRRSPRRRRSRSRSPDRRRRRDRRSSRSRSRSRHDRSRRRYSRSRRRRSRSYSRSRSRGRRRRRSYSRSPSRSRSRSSSYSRSRSPSYSRSRSRSRSDSRDRRGRDKKSKHKSKQKDTPQSNSDDNSSDKRVDDRESAGDEGEEAEPVQEQTKPKKSKKEKKAKKAKKKKKKKKKSGEGEDEPSGKAPAPGSVEYWNAERAKLGLKPLNSKGKK